MNLSANGTLYQTEQLFIKLTYCVYRVLFNIDAFLHNGPAPGAMLATLATRVTVNVYPERDEVLAQRSKMCSGLIPRRGFSFFVVFFEWILFFIFGFFCGVSFLIDFF